MRGNCQQRTVKGSPSAAHKRLVVDDEIIQIPDCDLTAVTEQFKQTLIGRTFNREGRSIDALISLLPKPKIWDVEGRTQGINLGNGRFQFDFDHVDDMNKVLAKRTLTALGTVTNIDAKRAKFQVSLNADKPLQFERKVGFPNGDIASVTLTYEGLQRHCFTCKLLSHGEASCPELTEEQHEEKKRLRLEELRQEALFGYGVNATTNSTRTKEAWVSQRTEIRDDHLYDDCVRTNIPKREYRQRSDHTSYSESRSQARNKSVSRHQDLRQELSKRRDSRGREVWTRLDRSHLDKRQSGKDRYHPYEKPTNERRSSRDVRKDSQQVWHPKKIQQLDTPTSRVSNMRSAVQEPPSDSQQTITERPNNMERSRTKAKGLLITYPTIAESERPNKRKGKEHVVELSKRKKMMRYMEKPQPLKSLSIIEPASNPAPYPGNVTHQDQDPTASLLTPMEEEFLANTEEGELDETLTADQIDYMINELAYSALDDVMLENDDLLGEELASDEERIDAISQLSPMVLQEKEFNEEMQEPEAEIPKNTEKVLQNAPQGRKKKPVPSPEKKGRQVSRKLQALLLKPSPKKKPTTGSVVSQKPPSKKI
ncbi:unnamed protein product [Microthlaspi erraticum]|uniref:Uncharacterized protein n=1 Tax=Microthlaspi erraticum TaxID=1685480 RepID=A0A6D2I2C6_9BRAS|nr:unnamed protein product [Microthlaspi erraticum]